MDVLRFPLPAFMIGFSESSAAYLLEPSRGWRSKITSEYRSITLIVSARLSPFSTEDDFKSEIPIELPPSDAIMASKPF